VNALWLSASLAFVALRRHLLRSSLTVLGLVIAVAALTTVSAVGVAARTEVAIQFATLGTNMIHVFPDSSGLKEASRLGEGDVRAIAKEVPRVKYVAPDIMQTLEVFAGDKKARPLVIGTTRSYAPIRNMHISEGSFWSEADEVAKARVCVIGGTLRERLFGDEDPLGKTIRIGREPYLVVGLHAPLGVSPVGVDFDDTVLMPVGTMRARVVQLHGDSLTGVLVSAVDQDSIGDVEHDVTELLRERHGVGKNETADFHILNQAQLVHGQSRSYDLLTMLLEAVAAISLFVGGVGVTNVMLVSVAERKREIGICLAIGAGPGQIALQFLVEAITLSLVGGLLGLLIGVAGSAILAAQYEWTTYLDVPTLSIGMAASLITGVVFGFVPALRAARLDPITAMRRE
jgi:putative ABC transport system permease protein